MALWDSFTKKASETTAKAVQQAKILAETTKLHGMVMEEEKKVSDLYQQIGKLYAEKYADEPGEGFSDLIAQIKEAEEKIAQYRTQIQDVKGVTRCEKCGAEVTKGAAFCSACGTAVVVAEAEAEVEAEEEAVIEEDFVEVAEEETTETVTEE